MSTSKAELRALSAALGDGHDLIMAAVRNLPEHYSSEGKVLCETIRAFKRSVDFAYDQLSYYGPE